MERRTTTRSKEARKEGRTVSGEFRFDCSFLFSLEEFLVGGVKCFPSLPLLDCFLPPSSVRPSLPNFFTGFPQFSSGLVGGLAFMFLYFVIYHPRTEQNAVRSAVGQGRNNKDATTDATTTAPGPGSKVVNGGILPDRRFTGK